MPRPHAWAAATGSIFPLDYIARYTVVFLIGSVAGGLVSIGSMYVLWFYRRSKGVVEPRPFRLTPMRICLSLLALAVVYSVGLMLVVVTRA